MHAFLKYIIFILTMNLWYYLIILIVFVDVGARLYAYAYNLNARVALLHRETIQYGTQYK